MMSDGPDAMKPSFMAVTRTQVLFLARSGAPATIGVAALLVVLVAEVVHFQTGLPPDSVASHFGSRFMWVAGAVWGLIVWRDEGPSLRGYYDALPISFKNADLARIAAGGAWLITVVAGLSTALAARTATGLPEAVLAIPLTVGSALVAYAMASAVSTAFDRPGEKMLLALLPWAGLAFLAAMAESTAWIDATAAVLVDGRLALGATLSGMHAVEARAAGLLVWGVSAVSLLIVASGRRPDRA